MDRCIDAIVQSMKGSFIVSNWKIFKNKTKSLTLAGVEKAKEASEITKINLNTMAEEEKINLLYAEVGKLYVQLHENSPEEGFEELFSKLAKVKEQIKKNKERVAQIKKEGNISDEDIVVYMDSETE